MKKDKPTLQKKVEELEKAEILDALRDSQWIKAKAAKILGITERMVGYKIKKYCLQKEVQEQTSRLKADRYRTQDSRLRTQNIKNKTNFKEDVER